MSELSPTLQKLLSENPPSGDAWAEFAREHTRLLMHVARCTSHGHDEAMDAYAYLLEKLSEDGCRRLRAYSSHPESKFTTWLVVVARRICVDRSRAIYGRVRNEDSQTERDRLIVRKKLANLDEGSEFVDSIPDEGLASPMAELEKRELTRELKELRASLPPADQLLLALRFDDGLSAAEIGVILKYPSQFHVYRRINLLLGELKARLKARGYESAAS
jgi:RNA polymerase sigma factor (sigma-70 family)